MSKYSDHKRTDRNWSRYARVYHPIKCGSIDGNGTEPHDKAVIRALNSRYKTNSRAEGDPYSTIFIGRLHPKTEEKTLKEHFEKFGKILRCRVVRDIVTGMSKRYAFIEFDKSSQADRAVRHTEKVYIDDNEIIVEHEFGRTMPGWKPRRLGGGFGGRKESGQLRFGARARPFQRITDIKKSATSLNEVFRKQKRKKKS